MGDAITIIACCAGAALMTTCVCYCRSMACFVRDCLPEEDHTDLADSAERGRLAATAKDGEKLIGVFEAWSRMVGFVPGAYKDDTVSRWIKPDATFNVYPPLYGNKKTVSQPVENVYKTLKGMFPFLHGNHPVQHDKRITLHPDGLSLAVACRVTGALKLFCCCNLMKESIVLYFKVEPDDAGQFRIVEGHEYPAATLAEASVVLQEKHGFPAGDLVWEEYDKVHVLAGSSSRGATRAA
jgi:hypothetical protein